MLGGPADKHNDSLDINEIEQDWYHSFGIEYIGNVVDVEAAIQKSSIYVLLSYNEGTPRSVLEAMSVGDQLLLQMFLVVEKQFDMGLMDVVPAKDLKGATLFL